MRYRVPCNPVKSIPRSRIPEICPAATVVKYSILNIECHGGSGSTNSCDAGISLEEHSGIQLRHHSRRTACVEYRVWGQRNAASEALSVISGGSALTRGANSSGTSALYVVSLDFPYTTFNTKLTLISTVFVWSCLQRAMCTCSLLSSLRIQPMCDIHTAVWMNRADTANSHC